MRIGANIMKKDQINKSLLVIIPARDEEIAVGKVIQGVQSSLPCDIVVVDDVSSDATIQVARKAGAHVIPLTVHLGSWGRCPGRNAICFKRKI